MDGILQAGVSREEAGRQDHKERKPKKLKTTEHCCKAPSKYNREIQGFHPLFHESDLSPLFYTLVGSFQHQPHQKIGQ